jgi:hypothetical protein
MQLRGSEIILQGKDEISDVLSSMPGHPLRNAAASCGVECKEFPLQARRDKNTPREPTEAEIAHAGLWDRAMQAKADTELLRFLGLSDTLGRFIIRVRSGNVHTEGEAVSDVPTQQAYEPQFVAPVIGSAPSMIAGPVLPIA